MSLDAQVRPPRDPFARHRSLRAFHRCPLCGSVSLVHETSCGVCGWRGVFDENPDRVAAGLRELAERCPDLADALLMEPPIVRDTGWRGWWRRFWRRGLDILA